MNNESVFASTMEPPPSLSYSQLIPEGFERDSEAPFTVVSIAYTLAGAELILHPISLALALLNSVILWRSSILHPNLQALLLCQSASIFAYELGRFLLVAEKFLYGDIFHRQVAHSYSSI